MTYVGVAAYRDPSPALAQCEDAACEGAPGDGSTILTARYSDQKAKNWVGTCVDCDQRRLSGYLAGGSMLNET